MAFSRENALPLALLAAAAFASALFVNPIPLYGDEAVYAEILSELSRSPLEAVPEYLGSPEPWKPPAGFYTYYIVSAAESALSPQIPPEYAYRLAPAFIAALTAFALYMFLREISGERRALLAAAIFAISNQTITTSGVLLLDSALLFYSVCALYCFARALRNRSWLLPAAALAALAALTKTYAALAVPVAGFALMYYYSASREEFKKTLFSPEFAAAMLAVPAAMLAYAAFYSLAVPGGGREMAVSYFYDSLGRIAGRNFAEMLAANSTELFKRMFPWGIASIAGAASLSLKSREDKFAGLWAAVSLIPLANASGYYWYLLPCVPPLAFLAARPLSQLKDAHLAAAFAALALLSLYAYPFASSGQMYPLLQAGEADIQEQKETGLAMKGARTALTITRNGEPGIIYYMLQGEPAPDYSGITQLVENPFGPASYSAFRGMAEIVAGEPKSVNVSCRGCVLEEISAHPAQKILLGKEAWAACGQVPPDGYLLAYTSESGAYAVLQRRG
jgi:4-amino-4-deoxy-L-arabinose transferase-like glycosyltransferase